MPKRAPILIAGRTWAPLAALLAAPALLAAVPATSQVVPSSEGLVIDNFQIQSGDIFAGQTLDVVDNYGLLSVEAQATGNTMQGGNQAVDATLNSVQTLTGTVTSDVVINGTAAPEDYRNSLGTPLYVNAQATGNALTFVTEGANAATTTNQSSSATAVHADAQVNSANNSIYQSGEVIASSVVNHQGYEVTQGRIENTSSQTSSTESRARVGMVLHYSPSPLKLTATAENNSYASNSDDRGSQEHTLYQRTEGATEAYVSLNGGNLWHSATEATAVGNDVNIANDGGSLVVDNTQENTAQVRATSILTGYEYGEMDSTARGYGNLMATTNEDIYVRLDNNQINSGGVDVVASFEGNDGWDTYVTAEAVGNQSLSYACAECGADMGADNQQINNAAVSATATGRVTGSGRSAVITSRAVGNSATYYVSGSK